MKLTNALLKGIYIAYWERKENPPSLTESTPPNAKDRNTSFEREYQKKLYKPLQHIIRKLKWKNNESLEPDGQK